MYHVSMPFRLEDYDWAIQEQSQLVARIAADPQRYLADMKGELRRLQTNRRRWLKAHPEFDSADA